MEWIIKVKFFIQLKASKQLNLAFLVLDAQIGSVGREEASNAGAGFLISTLASQTHEQFAHVLYEENLELAILLLSV